MKKENTFKELHNDKIKSLTKRESEQVVGGSASACLWRVFCYIFG